MIKRLFWFALGVIAGIGAIYGLEQWGGGRCVASRNDHCRSALALRLHR